MTPTLLLPLLALTLTNTSSLIVGWEVGDRSLNRVLLYRYGCWNPSIPLRIGVPRPVLPLSVLVTGRCYAYVRKYSSRSAIAFKVSYLGTHGLLPLFTSIPFFAAHTIHYLILEILIHLCSLHPPLFLPIQHRARTYEDVRLSERFLPPQPNFPSPPPPSHHLTSTTTCLRTRYPWEMFPSACKWICFPNRSYRAGSRFWFPCTSGEPCVGCGPTSTSMSEQHQGKELVLDSKSIHWGEDPKMSQA